MSTATKTKRKVKSKSPTVNVVFSTFDSSNIIDIYRPIRQSDIKNWIPLTINDYCPCGGTPLLDATARFIGHLDELKKKGTVVIGCLADESGSMGMNRQSVIDGINEFVGGMSTVDDVDSDTDGKVLAVIFTDGKENSSTEVDNKTLSKMISDREKDGWTFIYLGANQDAWSTSTSYRFSGTASGQSFNFAATPAGTRSVLRCMTHSASKEGQAKVLAKVVSHFRYKVMAVSALFRRVSTCPAASQGFACSGACGIQRKMLWGSCR